MKRIIFKNLDINVINLENILGEIRRRESTGFLRVIYWDKEDFLLFSVGIPFKLVSLNTEGHRLVLNPQRFKFETKEGSASLIETTLDDLVAFQEYRYSLKENGSLILFPFGTLIQEPISLGFLDLSRQFTLAQRSHLSGYMAFFTEETLTGIVVFENGKPITIVGGNLSFDHSAIEYISSSIIPSDTRLALYAVEPEFLPFFYSLKPENIKKTETLFMTYQEAVDYVISNKSSAVVVIESDGIHRYDFFFRGQLVERIVKEKGFIVTEEELKTRLALKVENLPHRTVTLYEVEIAERVKPLDIPLESIFHTISPPEGEFSPETIARIKSAFVEEVGPVGGILWGRIMADLGFRESTLNRRRMKILIERLRKEIPEEEASRKFVEKVRSILPDII